MWPSYAFLLEICLLHTEQLYSWEWGKCLLSRWQRTLYLVRWLNTSQREQKLSRPSSVVRVSMYSSRSLLSAGKPKASNL